MTSPLRAPFPYFGGKRRAADLVWSALGNVDHYVEPFAGSAAVLLARPHAGRCETINDADAMLANFWRAVAADPAAVARHADWPVNETDLHARHRWLIGQRESLAAMLDADPLAFDARVAGWWVWGLSCWIGDGWCKTSTRTIPFLGNTGMGIHSQGHTPLVDLATRLRGVRVACGDWRRVVSRTVLFPSSGTTGVFLDPPYTDGRMEYAAGGGGGDVATAAREWAAEHGSDPRLRIVLAGYEGEHAMPRGWRSVAWRAGGAGYVARDGERHNQKRERLWLSPHCLGDDALPLFGGAR